MSQAGIRKQMEILDFIERFQEENGYSPTVREIGAAVGLSSPSSVHNHIKSLTEKGLLQRDEKKSRVMRVAAAESPKEEKKVEPVVKKAAPIVKADDDFMIRHSVDSIPVVGNVAAGVPILAEENVEDTIPLSTDFIRGDASDTFILNVHGDSMINAGILDGDYVVVHSQSTARNGEIVVAMLDNEATVKRFYRESDHIRLQPENDYYEPIRSRDVQVVGKVVALLRRF
ncbi:MAG: transcriptional repressor LexA [Clostridia bacterium]|nr:transcriptional repressor LexA [Clostridia bacterium]